MVKSNFQIQATLVANQFIDNYMASANGEYVKVYLYMHRHEGKGLTVGEIADGLNHTESDVRRAIAYWVKLGVLTEEGKVAEADKPVSTAEEKAVVKQKRSDVPLVEKKAQIRPVYTPEQVNRLATVEDFTQLLYIAQKYMNKVFTPRDCELFAYLYDGLHMSMELLEYLVEYCVQGGHASLRYLETVALNWHEQGICTVDAAKTHVSAYTKDAYAVMKALGLNDRKPGDAEIEMMKRWFREYGFARELVVEACNRTITAIHTPSFQYVDKILGEWKKAGVKGMRDVRALDEKRENKTVRKPVPPKSNRNQFHNFEQRDTNYDAMVLERLKERLGEQ